MSSFLQSLQDNSPDCCRAAIELYLAAFQQAGLSASSRADLGVEGEGKIVTEADIFQALKHQLKQQLLYYPKISIHSLLAKLKQWQPGNNEFANLSLSRNTINQLTTFASVYDNQFNWKQAKADVISRVIASVWSAFTDLLLDEQDKSLQKLKKTCEEYCDYLQKKMQENQNRDNTVINQKLKTTNELIETLKTNESPESQLNTFGKLFQTKRHLLEKDRDTQTIKALKIISTILLSISTLGLGLAASINIFFRIKGKETCANIDKQLRKCL